MKVISVFDLIKIDQWTNFFTNNQQRYDKWQKYIHSWIRICWLPTIWNLEKVICIQSLNCSWWLLILEILEISFISLNIDGTKNNDSCPWSNKEESKWEIVDTGDVDEESNGLFQIYHDTQKINHFIFSLTMLDIGASLGMSLGKINTFCLLYWLDRFITRRKWKKCS